MGEGLKRAAAAAKATRITEEQAEIRRLSEQRRALSEVERLMRNGRPVPPLLREKALGK